MIMMCDLSQLRYVVGQIKSTNEFGSLLQATASLDCSSKAQTRSWHDMHWALVGSIYVYLLAFLQAMLHLTYISLSWKFEQIQSAQYVAKKMKLLYTFWEMSCHYHGWTFYP